MLRLLVDSGSSIKLDECEKYNIELIPLNILLGEKEYLDGYNLPMDEFYKFMIEEKGFPKTSLPNLAEVEEKVNGYVAQGDDVIILTISSKISGWHNAARMLFEGNEHVLVLDSCMAVGGLRLIVDEINKDRTLSLKQIEEKIKKFIPRIKIMAIPETLEYLFRGGRLSKLEWLVGSLLKIKPIIGFKDGKVSVLAKKIGLKNGMKYICEALKEYECDENYDIIASYTYEKKNLDALIEMADEKYRPLMRVTDNLDPAIACHWGPGAFGFVFVGKK